MARYNAVTFDDIIEFLRGEIVMRLYGISKDNLNEFNVSEDSITSYERVRLARSQADRPAYKRPAPHNSAGVSRGTFDPIIAKAIRGMNEEWGPMHFLLECRPPTSTTTSGITALRYGARMV